MKDSKFWMETFIHTKNVKKIFLYGRGDFKAQNDSRGNYFSVKYPK